MPIIDAMATVLLISCSALAGIHSPSSNERSDAFRGVLFSADDIYFSRLSDHIMRRCDGDVGSRPDECNVPEDMKPVLEKALSEAMGERVTVE